MLLESYGLCVEDFASAREFLSRGAKGRCGCLLLDLHMPEMGGLELLNRLRNEGTSLPTIVISGRNDPTATRHAKAAGALAVLDKPVDDETLIRSISGALAGPRH